MMESLSQRKMFIVFYLLFSTMTTHANQYDFTILTDDSSVEDFRCTANEVTDNKGYTKLITALSCVPIELREQFKKAKQMEVLTGELSVYGPGFNSTQVDAVVQLKKLPIGISKQLLQTKGVNNAVFADEITDKLPTSKWIAGKYGELKNMFNHDSGRRGMCIFQQKLVNGAKKNICSHMLIAKTEPKLLTNGVKEEALDAINLFSQRVETFRFHSKHGKAIWLGLFSDQLTTNPAYASVEWNYLLTK